MYTIDTYIEEIGKKGEIGEWGGNRETIWKLASWRHGCTWSTDADRCGTIDPMFTVSVKDNIKDVVRKLGAWDSSQIPFATAKALTRTAQDASKNLKQTIAHSFDRPTPYTLNSLYVSPATKQRLEATVKLKDDTSKGTPANKYLAPSIWGGQRNIKRVERLLSARGILPAGMSVVPGSGAKLDQYGNVSRGQYSKILAQLQANNDVYQNESIASRKRKAKKSSGRYFVGQPGGGKSPAGVWERTSFSKGSAIKPVLLFVKTPSYHKQFAFFETVEKTIHNRFETNFREAMQQAIATKR